MAIRSLSSALLVPLLVTLVPAACRVGPPPAPTKLYEVGDNAWYEGSLTRLSISQDGSRALFRLLRKPHLVALATGQEDQTTLLGRLDQIDDAAFCGPTQILRRGKRGADHGWFQSDSSASQPVASLPEDAVVTCAADGQTMAYYRTSQPRGGIFVGRVPDFKNYAVDGDVSAVVFSPDRSAVFVTSMNDAGVSSLAEINLSTSAARVIANDLDMMPGSNTIGVASGGRQLYLALASPGAPDNTARHDPMARRFLQVYEVDAASGTRKRAIASADTMKDSYDPNVVGGALYWSTVLPHKAVAVVPIGGGDVREVMTGGDLPMWSPDGHRISYTYDYDRMTDGALPMDVGVISVDSGVHRTSEPAAFVTGYHEDFSAAWSPDGRWIAWHSHRPPTPVPLYDSPGHTDDVYLRRAEDRHAPELRLTDFGWEVGPPYWSPDGRRLLFSSWDKGGTPYIDKLWIATIDPASGKLLHADRVPLPPTVRSAMWAMWSPNGKEIAIEDNEDNGKRTLWVVQPDGSHAQKLVDYSGNTYGALDWTIDGKSIVYAGLGPDGRNQLFEIPRRGGAPQQITHDSANLIHPRISPNGQWIAATRLQRMHQIWRMPL